MNVWSESFANGERIPERCAMGKHDPSSHATFAGNANPHIAWAELPSGTRSLVLLCIDHDAPTKPDDVNQEGRTVPADLPRADFVHWVLVDLRPDGSPIAEGEMSSGVTPRGKAGPAGPRGSRHGLNDYTGWFRGDADLEGQYFGYDGPFPPWNDSLVHHYEFTLYALDIERCPVEGDFDAQAVQRAIEGHVLGQASFVGTYAINPDARVRGR